MDRLSSRPLPLLALLLCACNAKDTPGPETPAPASQARAAPADGSLMAPGRPQITALAAIVAPGMQRIGWAMWWGENGREWVLHVNGERRQSGVLKVASPKQQDGAVDLLLEQPGRYEIRIGLCNDHGCSESEPVVMEVASG